MSDPDKHVPPKRDPNARFGTRAVHAGWEPDASRTEVKRWTRPPSWGL